MITSCQLSVVSYQFWARVRRPELPFLHRRLSPRSFGPMFARRNPQPLSWTKNRELITDN